MQPALSRKHSAKDQPTVCVLCSHNCGLRVDVDENRVVAVRADEHNPITRGHVCNKGFSIAHYIEHEQRVQRPLKRTPNGSFEEISWDQAVTEIGTKLRKLADAHTGRCIGLVGVGGQGNHLDGAYALALLQGFESPWWFNALAQEKTQHALVDRWLFDAHPTSHFHADIEHSQFALVIGTNPMLSNRGARPREFLRELSKDPERTLVVVDPRATETAAKADTHLAVRPGSDVYLLLAMAAVILNESLVDRAFAERHIDDLSRLDSELGCLDVAELSRLAGLAEDEVRKVARGFAAARSASIFVDLGLEQSRYSTLTAYLMRVLCGLTGNLGNRGGMIWMGLFGAEGPAVDSPPPKAPESGIEGICMWTPFAGFSYNLVPEEVLADRPDRLRALIVEGANPLLQGADTPAWRKAVEALELLVVIDPAMSETAQLADYVLPASCGYEKWEYAGFPKGYPGVYAQVRPPVVRGPEEALAEPEIYRRIAAAAGLIDEVPRALGWTRVAASNPIIAPIALAAHAVRGFLETPNLRRALPRLLFGLYDTVGAQLPDRGLTFIWFSCITYALAQRADILRVHPEAARFRNPFALGQWLFEQLMEHPEGFHVGDVDAENNLGHILRTHDGKIHFAQTQMFDEVRRALADPAEPSNEYPLLLDAGLRTRWNANSVQRNPAWRKGKGPHCAVWLHPDDAAAAGAKAGSQLRVTSVTGSVELPAHVDSTVMVGHIHIPNGFGQRYPDAEGALQTVGVNVNELTDAASRDPFTGCPYHKYVPCRVELVGAVEPTSNTDVVEHHA